MNIVYLLIGLVLGGAAGAGIGIPIAVSRYTRRQQELGEAKVKLAEEDARQIRTEAKDEARTIRANAEDDARETIKRAEREAKEVGEEADQTARRRRRDLDREDERLQRRRDELDKRFERLERRESNLNKRQSRLDQREQGLQALEDQQQQELTRVAHLTLDEARQEVLELAEQDARNDVARIIRQAEAEARETADRRARDLIALAVQRLAGEQVSETSVTVVPLPSDDMKGRIIGRNGRNIRAFEYATGVDVVVDDTPEAVTISSFNPVRREVAKRAMTKLVDDGRIHPARIEQIVESSQDEVENTIREEGEQAAYLAHVHGLNPELLKMLGQLKFRTSYGQNMHAHSIETANIASMIASELGADVEIARTGGLLHDIGKAIDHEIEGTHAAIGADFARRYGVKPAVVNCIASHHHEVEQTCVEAYIVEAADAISGARPGARRESLEAYIKRIKLLEDVANQFEGVQQSYALQAGREVRIIVRPDVVDDFSASRLSRDIARKIEETMQYPGQIKVQVIRETRSVEYAK